MRCSQIYSVFSIYMWCNKISIQPFVKLYQVSKFLFITAIKINGSTMTFVLLAVLQFIAIYRTIYILYDILYSCQYSSHISIDDRLTHSYAYKRTSETCLLHLVLRSYQHLGYAEWSVHTVITIILKWALNHSLLQEHKLLYRTLICTNLKHAETKNWFYSQHSKCLSAVCLPRNTTEHYKAWELPAAVITLGYINADRPRLFVRKTSS